MDRGLTFEDFRNCVVAAHRREMALLDGRALDRAIAHVEIAKAWIGHGHEDLAKLSLDQAIRELRAIAP